MTHPSCVRASIAQRGFTLLLVLIFLLLISVLVMSGLRAGTTNLQIAGNMQARQEAIYAARLLLEQTVSTNEFATNPAGVAAAAVINTDYNGDGVTDSIATLQNAAGTVTPPACIRARPIPVSELDINNANDAPCFQSSSVSNSGIITTPVTPTGSLCADTEWDLTARGSDVRTGSSVVMHQGVAVRTTSIDLQNKCK